MPDDVHERPCSGPEPPEETISETMVKIEDRIDPQARAFYRKALMTVQAGGIPVLVGGAFAFEFYTGISRYTKDFDIFVRSSDAAKVLKLMAAAGYETEITAAHWLAKACSGGSFVDIIFGEANGANEVDDTWFDHSVSHSIFGVDLALCPVEEMICSKAFVMDRDRFDGADVAHLIRQYAEKLDWDRILRRFGDYWKVLLAHLVLFTFIYPSEAGRIPSAVMQDLLRRLDRESGLPAVRDRLCRGTLLSMTQYRIDVIRWQYEDARELKQAL